MKDLHSPSMDRLFRSILKLENTEECYLFFEDLCTIKELQDMAKRLETAVLLSRGESYQTISERTGVSAATISRVSKCLNYGDGGYRRALDRLKEEEDGR